MAVLFWSCNLANFCFGLGHVTLDLIWVLVAVVGGWNFYLRGYSSGGQGTKVPREKNPGRGLGDQAPQKQKQFADIVYRFLLQKRSKFEISHNSPLYS